MISLKSKTLCNYYGTNPDEYYIKFIHHNIDVDDVSEDEYQKIEQDLEKIYNFDKNAFILYFSDVLNYFKVINHINILTLYKDKIYLRIRHIDDYKKLKQINRTKGIKIIVELSDIDKLNITDLDLIIQIDNIIELPITKLNELLDKYKIQGVLLGQIPYLTKNDIHLFDVMSKTYNVDSSNLTQLEKLNKITNDIYKLNDFIKITNKFKKILNYLDIQDQLDGFYKIFNYIASTVSYDEKGVEKTQIKNQNLIGAVLNEKAVCEGYSKYLQQLLSLIGIESIIVQGDGHVWNQVLINNKWYNADVTAASYSINNNEKIKTCLVKDDEILCKTNTSISFICDENFDYKKLNLKK